MQMIRHAVAPTRQQVLDRGSGIDRHRHDDPQLVYAARGLLAVTTPAGSWVAPMTRAIWVPSGVDHEHVAYGRVELNLVGVSRDVDPLGVDQPATLHVSPLLRELIREYASAPHETGSMRGRLWTVLLDQLSAAPHGDGALRVPTSPLLGAIAAAFRADPADRRTLRQFGYEVGASERTLSRMFRAEVGTTFPRWRTRLRLHHALSLLAEDIPVTVVAHRCGWASASAFISVFRQEYGYTPGRRSS
jgi:AraC-like DNA-binding protein